MEVTLKELIGSAITARYVVTDEPTLGFGDSTIPKILKEEGEVVDPLLSPNLAEIFGGHAIPFQDFLAFAGVDMGQVKQDLLKLKEREITLIAVGYGGASINLLHFIGKFCELTSVHYPFHRLAVYESDNLSLLNALRLYKPITGAHSAAGVQNKTQLLASGPERLLAPTVTVIPKFITTESVEYDTDGGTHSTARTISERIPNVVFFGAPNFAGREALAGDDTAPFLFTGHAGTEFDIWRKPKVDTSLGVESYGLIDLSVLFPNLLVGAAALLHILAEGEEQGDADTRIFHYDITKEGK